MSETQSSAFVQNRDGTQTEAQKDTSNLLDRLFKAITKRLPDEDLAVRSGLATVVYEEFFMWANNLTPEEYATADAVYTKDDDG